jgi:ethanolamine utilization protein EutA (predicted chaperonin)
MSLKVQEELKGRKMVQVNEDNKRLNAILEYFNRLYRDYPLIVFVTTTFGTALVFILKDKFGEKFLNYIVFDVVRL